MRRARARQACDEDRSIGCFAIQTGSEETVLHVGQRTLQRHAAESQPMQKTVDAGVARGLRHARTTRASMDSTTAPARTRGCKATAAASCSS